jgi:hypothetical protein
VARRGFFVGDDQFDIVFIPSAASALVTPAAGDDPEVGRDIGRLRDGLFLPRLPHPGAIMSAAAPPGAGAIDAFID